MKRILSTILFLTFTLWSGYLLAGAILHSFTAKSTNGDIILQWSTGEEKDLARFEVQRKAGLQGEYTPLATITPKGSNSFYEYVDKSAYKSSDTIYKYRLAIVNTDGSVAYSQELVVPHGVSGVKRTWGSIKAMFR
jgi:hypothetical protein